MGQPEINPAQISELSREHVGNTLQDKVAARFRDEAIPQGYGEVAKTVGSGAAKELLEHPVKVGAIAVGTGAVTELATAFLKKPALIALGVGGGLYTGHKLYENVPKWINSANVVANGAKHTLAERTASQKVLSELGAGGVDLAAGGFGAGISKPLVNFGRGGYARVQAAPVVEAAPVAELKISVGTAERQSVKAAAGLKDAPAPTYTRNDNIEVPTGVWTERESEAVVHFMPDGTAVKIKYTPITSATEEADALAALGRTGVRVPKVFDVGKTADGHQALTMETVVGDTYRDVVMSGDRNRLTAAMHDFQRQIGIMARSGVAADDIQFKNIIIGPTGNVHFIDPLRIVAKPDDWKVGRILENMILNGARPEK